MKKNQITLIPFGGLGNRMRVINSTLEWVKSNQVKLKLVWIVKDELAIPFFEIFKSIGIDFSTSNIIQYSLFKAFMKHIFVNRYSPIYKFILSIFYDKILFDEDIKKSSNIELQNQILGYKRVLIATCYQFNEIENFNNYILTESIKIKVKAIVDKFDANTIGVHIRRTDHTEIIELSPIAKFIEQMNLELRLNPETNFFLATDDLEVKELLINTFVGKVFYQETILTRKSNEGMIGAVVDIYCLAATKKIIGTSKSSFAKTASLIGKPKEIIELT